MGVIEDVKLKTDIVEVIGEYTKLTKSGRRFRGLCPFHSEKDPSFFVFPEQQSWHCFGSCNTGGDVFAFIMKKMGVDFGEALRILAERAGVTLPTFSTPEDKGRKEKIYKVNEAAAEFYHQQLLSPTGQKIREYLAGRGLNMQTVAQFKLGLSPNAWDNLKKHLAELGYSDAEMLEAGLIRQNDKGGYYDQFRNRLMFPICDARGRVTGFGARALDDSQPKYLNSPQTPAFDKSSTLYGINFAAQPIRNEDKVIIVEGYMDVIGLHQGGFRNVIACMGTSITDRHIEALKKLTKNIYLALDSDSAGEEAMLKCIDYENTLASEIKVILLPPGKDPDEVVKESGENWRKAVEQAIPVLDFTFNMTTSGLDLSSAAAKTRVTDKLLPIIARISNPIRKDHYLQKLGRLVKISDQSLAAALNKTQSPVKQKNQPKTPAQTLPARVSNPVEEYCLSLLLQYPDLEKLSAEVSPEDFSDTKNREIFVAYRKVKDVELLYKEIDSALRDYAETLLARKLPASDIEQKFTECTLRLREQFLRNLEMTRSEVLAQARETGGTSAELASLSEQGTGTGDRLAEVFTKKNRRPVKGGKDNGNK